MTNVSQKVLDICRLHFCPSPTNRTRVDSHPWNLVRRASLDWHSKQSLIFMSFGLSFKSKAQGVWVQKFGWHPMIRFTYMGSIDEPPPHEALQILFL